MASQSLHARYALGNALGIALFCVTIHMAGQGHDSVLNLDADLRGVDRGFPLQFCDNILLQL